jgi:type I restriction enzyme S subunit
MPSGRNGEAFGSTEFIVIRGKDGVTDNDFAYYLTMWPEFREFAISQMTGSSGRQRVPVDSLAGFNFNLPPLTEQKAIAHILGSLDDKIELNRRMNETLETMAQALFKSWFVDFDPVIDNAIAARNEIPEELKERAYIREALGDVRKKLPEEIHNLFPSEFEHTEEMGWIPKGWEVGPLAEIARLETKSVQPGNRPNEVWTHFSIPAFDEGRMPKKELGETIKSGKYIVPSTAVLASKLNPQFPRVWLPDVDSEDTCICSTEFMPFVPLNDVERPYLYAFLRSKIAQSEIVKRATGSTGSRQRVKPPEIAAMPIVIPSKTLRERFCSLTGGDYQKLTANMKNIKNLTSARESLLPKLLSGEIRIPEAEKLVEDLNKNGGNNGKS